VTSKIDFATVEVVPNLPAVLPSHQWQPFPEDLQGATIVTIGTVGGRDRPEGGGLVIDYRPAGGRVIRRIVFGLNELGMWVEYKADLPDGGHAALRGEGRQ
jgi:hypothetical protein